MGRYISFTLYQDPFRFSRSDLRFFGVYIYEVRFAENRDPNCEERCGKSSVSAAGKVGLERDVAA